jgi:hypothetical protein
MKSDEEQIRELVSTWMAATKSGEIEVVLGLMTDDVVFLVPGRPAMRKSEFAAALRSQASGGAASSTAQATSRRSKSPGTGPSCGAGSRWWRRRRTAGRQRPAPATLSRSFAGSAAVGC